MAASPTEEAVVCSFEAIGARSLDLGPLQKFTGSSWPFDPVPVLAETVWLDQIGIV
jgi:hypothetical protein